MTSVSWPFLLVLVAACGNVDRMEVDLRFSDPEIEASTRQLLVVIRQPAPAGGSCEALWGAIQPGLGETARLVDYPNREDMLVVPLEANPYSIFAYAYPVRLTGVPCTSSAVCPSDWICENVDGGQKACVPPDSSARSLGGACGLGSVGQEPTLVELEVAPRP
jgi:hypothetical protein